MATKQINGTSAAGGHTRLLPILLLLLVGSGGCALIYEIVWFQLLELVIGSSAISLGVLLATYMGGLCIGSLYFPRKVSPEIHPLRAYAFLELGIAGFGILVLLVVPLVSGVWSASGGSGFVAIFMRALLCAICILPPTILMGATLPAVSRWLETTKDGVAWMGFLYGGNTAGAVVGSVLAGFWFLRRFDLMISTFIAVAINLFVAAFAFMLAGRSEGASKAARAPEPAERAQGSNAVYWVIALSGMCALGAEVVWTRLLSLMLGGTVYTFSMILAVFLSGLGIGSAIGAALGRATRKPRVALGWCQFLQMAAIAWAALLIGKAFPNWPINPSLSPSPWFVFQLDLSRVIWAVFPASLLWGASFPLALTVAAQRGQEPARLVSGIYAANTVGAIFGSLGFSLLVIPWVGTQNAQRLLIAIAAVAGVLMFLSLLQAKEGEKREVSAGSALAQLNAGAIAGLILIAVSPAVPGLLVAYGRYAVTWINQIDIKYIGEGRNSSIAVSTLRSSGATQFHVAGKVEASSLPQDMRLQRMLGHLPALVHPNPKSVLIVGFGAGVTSGTFVPYPDINRIVIAEIEPLIPKVVSTYFSKENNNVMQDRRTQVIYDDARSVILTIDEKFDIITSDPIHPWVKGAASLYTKEYFEAVRDHLNPGGVVSQWVPLYESNVETVKSEIATFFEVFPNGTIWANNKDGSGYDVVLLGTVGPANVDLNALAQRMGRPEYGPVIASLMDVSFNSPVELFSTYAGRASDLKPWLQDAVINRDRNLRLQYLAATGLNEYNSGAIFSQIEQYRRWPEDIFKGPEGWVGQLREYITTGTLIAR
jgi:spermidine synthase